MNPSFTSANNAKHKGQGALIRAAIRLLRDGNGPEALGCLMAYEQKRKDAASGRPISSMDGAARPQQC